MRGCTLMSLFSEFFWLRCKTVLGFHLFYQESLIRSYILYVYEKLYTMLKSKFHINNRTWPAWFVLGIGLVCTFLASALVQERSVEDDIKHFSFSADQITQKIDERLRVYSIILEGCSSLFHASNTVTRKDWHDYIDGLHLAQNVPGSLGVGFNQIIPKDKLKEHITHIRNEGFVSYSIHPDSPRELYSSVVYIEPFVGRNLKAFGYDALSEPKRKAAMQRARDTGKAALTGKITLVQEEDKDVQAGAIMYLPIYKKTMPAQTLEEKRSSLIGWVSLPYRLNDVMNGILKNWQMHDTKTIAFKIYDTKEITEATLLFESTDKTIDYTHPSVFLQKRSINFNEHEWTLFFDRTGTFSAFAYAHVIVTAIIGLFLSALLFGLILSIRTTRANAKRIAESLSLKVQKNKALLKQNEAYLQNLIHVIPDLVWLKNQEGIYLTCNSRFESLYGASKADIIGKNDYDFVETSIADSFRKNDFLAITAGRALMNEELLTFASDGHQELVETTKVPVFDEAGMLLGVLGIGHDITQRKRSEDTLRKLSIALEQSPTSVVITDLDSNIEYVNPRFTEITGYSTDEVMHKNPRILQSGKMEKTIYLDMWEKLTEGKIWKGEFYNKRKNGELYWEEARIAPIKNAEGVVIHYVAIKIESTQRKEYENQIKTLLEDQKAILDSRIVGIVKLKARKILWLNEEFANMHGYASYELIGETTRILYPDDTSFTNFGEQVYPLLHGGETVRINLQLRHKDGSLKWFKIGGGQLHSYSDESIWSFIDITEQKSMESEINHLAFYDVLTQLPNRRLLDDRLAQALSKSSRSGLYGALMFLDLDNFKPLNDTYGHHVGDILLIEAAKRLKKRVREIDTIARFGGDEFIIIMNDLDPDANAAMQLARKVANKVRHSLAKPYHLRVPTDTHHTMKVSHQCTTSIGAVLFQDHHNKQEDILKWADDAMYQAKKQGGNRVIFLNYTT